MLRLLAVLAATLALSGCSFLVEMIVFNNSDARIQVCNLNYIVTICEIIEPKSSLKILLTGDKPAPSITYSIKGSGEERTYRFVFEPYPAQASEIYCQEFLMKRCDIPLQYEPDGLLYWAGKDQVLPVERFPAQPPGFPVSPD
ncbi:hypothetical protein [Pseudomonas sp. zfem005]|uniref:hypothetical protein n=1 Tax=Pseudomonas sp. zfem005 TaxID=3078200 RepID=UPI0029291D80|nr:hypothetical protein [Pseudomonas sp. zfem005]MDU9414899.1 hypothetical protein [Pseudomonas sp. zfem005]